jgi:cytochrome P450
MPAEVLFNPRTQGFLENPYPFYDKLRREEPWHLSPMGYHVVSRFDDVAAVLRDRRFEKKWTGPKGNKLDAATLDRSIFRSITQWMLERNPPDHTRVRSAFVQAFSAKRIEAMRSHIQAIVDRTLDELEPRGEMDVIEDFALSVPLMAITDVLGVPQEDRELMFRVSRFIGRLSDPVPLHQDEIAAIDADFETLAAYFEGLIEERRVRPGEDLISQVLAASDETSNLSMEELVGNLVLIFVAGHETTTNIIGSAMLALHNHPDQMALLRATPSLMPRAVGEFLRYDNSIQIASRTAKENVKFGDVQIEEGRDVLLLLGAANRDPTVFANPDKLDIMRPETQLASFGGGIHFCLGAQMSKMEIEIAMNGLLRRLPDFKLSEPDAVKWRPSIVMRGPEHLPASWKA